MTLFSVLDRTGRSYQEFQFDPNSWGREEGDGMKGYDLLIIIEKPSQKTPQNFNQFLTVKRVKIAVGSTASAHKNSENSYLEALSLHCSSITSNKGCSKNK